MTLSIKKTFGKIILLLALALPGAVLADLIVIELLPEGGATPESLGDFDMTAFGDPIAPEGGCTTSTASPISGDVNFEDRDHNDLCMTVQDPEWWEWDHGEVFTTSVNWVELVMPEQTRAFSLYVGANMFGRGWIEGIAADGSKTRTYFGGSTGIDLGPGSTPGFGVYATGSCSTITRIIVEPFEWGTGEFAINQDPCSTTVPEPGTLGLLGLGLLGLATARRRLRRVLKTR